MLRAELEPINERLDRVEAGTPRGQQQNIPNRQRGGMGIGGMVRKRRSWRTLMSHI
jgi:hypothetical protein